MLVRVTRILCRFPWLGFRTLRMVRRSVLLVMAWQLERMGYSWLDLARSLAHPIHTVVCPHRPARSGERDWKLEEYHIQSWQYRYSPFPFRANRITYHERRSICRLKDTIVRPGLQRAIDDAISARMMIIHFQPSWHMIMTHGSRLPSIAITHRRLRNATPT